MLKLAQQDGETQLEANLQQMQAEAECSWRGSSAIRPSRRGLPGEGSRPESDGPDQPQPPALPDEKSDEPQSPEKSDDVHGEPETPV